MPTPAQLRARLLLAVALVAIGSCALFVVPTPARAAPSTTPVTGAIVGPSILGTNLSGSYQITASGGPAEAANGSVSGVFSYKASLIGADTGGSAVTPTQGVLVNQSVSVRVTAPRNASQVLTLSVEITSAAALGTKSANATTNLTYAITVVVPYRLTTTLFAGSVGLEAFNLTVTLDGAPVGVVPVSSLLAGSSFPVVFAYATTGLAVGWHTFAISLAAEHGLVTFAGGAEQFTQSFYVAGPAPDYTLWYVSGALAFVAAVIWTTRVGARRRTKPKK